MSRRVLVVGPWEPGALAKSYCTGFSSARCAVEHFDPAADFRPSRIGRVGMRAPVIRERVWDRWQEVLLQQAPQFKADLILVLKGQWLQGDAVRLLRERTGAAVVNFFPDDLFDDSTFAVRLQPAASVYDRFYTFVHAFVPRLIALGARAGYLPFAWDPEMHPVAREFTRDLCDVSFVGSWSSDREEWLEQVGSVDLGLWGNWNHLSTCTDLRKSVRGPARFEGDMIPILSRSAISLNLIRVVSNGHNMRSYEALGIGAFLLSNRTPELTSLFREGEELACFSTPEELRDKVRFYLRHDTERLRIASLGHQRVARDTYEARARFILKDLFGNG